MTERGLIRWRFVATALLVIDVLAVTGGLRLAYLLRFHGSWLIALEPRDPTVTVRAMAMLAAAWISAFAIAGLYQRRRVVSGLSEYQRVATASAATTLAVIVVAFLGTRVISRGFLFMAMALVILLACAGRFVLRRTLYFAASRGLRLDRVVILGTNRHAIAVARQLDQTPSASCIVEGFLSDYLPVGAKVAGRWRVIGDPLQLEEVARARGASRALVVESALAWESLRHVVLLMHRRNHLEISLLPSLMDLHATAMEPLRLGPVFTLAPHPARIVGIEAVAKRALDLALAPVLLLLAVPIMGVLVLASALGGDGAGLRRRSVVTPGQRRFLWRHVSPSWARTGHLARLPELFHVVLGGMSLVGPRPVMAGEEARYEKAMPFLEAVKPGFIGPWWLIGQGRPDDPEEELAHDLWYLRNYSIGLDLQILVQTLRGIVRGGTLSTRLAPEVTERRDTQGVREQG